MDGRCVAARERRAVEGDAGCRSIHEPIGTGVRSRLPPRQNLRAVRTATALFGERWIERLVRPVMHEFTGRAGGGVVAAKIERDDAGGFSVIVRTHEQTPVELAELAEKIEVLVNNETASAGGVRLGRRLAGP